MLDQTRQARSFYLAGEFRRSALWAIAGCLLILVVIWCFDVAPAQQGAGRKWPLTVVLGLIAVWLSQYLIARIKVDDEGLRRRIAWWWELWPWEAFVEGQVRLGRSRFGYEFPMRPWWRRTLALDFLEEADALAIRELIGRVWRERSPAEVPEALSLQLNWPDSRRVELTAEEIAVTKKQERVAYAWDIVQGVEIWRLEHGRRDFRELELRFPDQRLTWREHHDRDHGNWTGGSSEVVASVLQQHVDPELVRDFALYGPAKTQEEIDRRQARDEAQRAEVESVMKWCVRGMWVLTAAMPFMFPWAKGLVMMFHTGLLAIAMQWMRRERARQIDVRLRNCELQRATLPEQRDCSDT